MIRKLRILLPLLFLLTASASALSPPTIYQKVVKSVVHISTIDRDNSIGSGTGFLAVAPDIVITSWHVVKDAKFVLVKFEDGERVVSPGWVARSLREDIVMLRAPTRKRPRLKLSYKVPPIGSRVYTLGSPNEWEYTFLDGIVSQYRRWNGVNLTQISCPCYYGSSGSPVLNKEGNTIGVVDSIDKNVPGVTFAIEPQILKKLYPHGQVIPWN